MSTTVLLYIAGALLAIALLRKVQLRIELSRAKHRSLAGHARWSRRLAAFVPFYEYDEEQFFSADDAPDDIAAQRRAGFQRLADLYARRFATTARATAEIESGVSDLQFTSRNRVPFQFSAFVRKHLKAGSFLESSSGATVTDLDGNRLYDVTGS
jgi:glutamate-1-semialdehyde 2,1-aminomutase